MAPSESGFESGFIITLKQGFYGYRVLTKKVVYDICEAGFIVIERVFMHKTHVI